METKLQQIKSGWGWRLAVDVTVVLSVPDTESRGLRNSPHSTLTPAVGGRYHPLLR